MVLDDPDEGAIDSPRRDDGRPPIDATRRLLDGDAPR